MLMMALAVLVVPLMIIFLVVLIFFVVVLAPVVMLAPVVVVDPVVVLIFLVVSVVIPVILKFPNGSSGGLNGGPDYFLEKKHLQNQIKDDFHRPCTFGGFISPVS